MLRALAIAHHYDYDPGLIGVAATQHGIELEMVAREDRRLPDAREFDLIIPFGSAWSVAAGDEPDAVAEEQTYLRDAHDRRVPVFGICFGGQQLAAALGGRVFRSSTPEIGPVTIETSDPRINPGPWLQFHLDEFEPPPGSTVLASTTCAQVFSIGRSWGLQFHPEVTTATVERWVDQGGHAYLPLVGTTPEQLFNDCTVAAAGAQERTTELLSSFLHTVGLMEAQPAR